MNNRGAYRSLSRNKKAYFDYEILDTVEGGLVLTGGEVKSVKSGLASIKESYVTIKDDEIWLLGAHIPLWKGDTGGDYDPLRIRKILLRREEIDSLAGKVNERGLTLVCLKLYEKKGKVKIEIGLARGKKRFEKRQTERERQLNKELQQERRKYMV